ncbi:MAG TPA: NADH-quinone oxidoreductase subunit L [Pirellulales bacterium]|jgi:NADH-quinone oxidoreductase subunit L
MFEGDNIKTLMVLIPAMPLASTLITALFGRSLLRERSHLPTIFAFVASFVLSLFLLFEVRARVAEVAHAADASHGSAAVTDAAAAPAQPGSVGVEVVHTLWTWARLGDEYQHPTVDVDGQPAPSDVSGRDFDFVVDVSLRADPLTAIMLCMVTFVSSLVALYAVGYMHDDRGYWRFFTYVSLFVFSMTMLVSVSNFVMLYVFWEAVGVCSYLLVGFWYEKPAAVAAGKKAFLLNRVGDFGFAIGLFLLWVTYGTLNFHDTAAAEGTAAVAGILGQTRLASPELYVGGTLGLAICLCLLTGACGKSAQFPLHVWLPDAMEGPTPVSALIHAATMVTAGVYMVARCTPLFVAAPESQEVVAAIGGFTALLAALIAVTQTDLKRVLAYSTISQLGYMFLGLGAGTLAGISAGMFHLFTHAFFKALLFLAAGSVMHAMGGVIDMRRIGGLRFLLPTTFWTFWFGALALSGVFPFAGFWSKDAVIGAIGDRSHAGVGVNLYTVLFWASLFTAFLTAFYTFRGLFLTFYGRQRVPPEAGHHAHESPSVMTIPLMVLALCALAVGAVFEWGHTFVHFLGHTPSLAYEGIQATAEHGGGHGHLGLAAFSTLVAISGVGLAAYFYLGDRKQIEQLTRWMSSPAGLRLYQLSSGKFYIDAIYEVLIVWPLRLLAAATYWFDRFVIDGLVNFMGHVPVVFGAILRSLQSGMVQFYALVMVLGTLVLIGTLFIWPMG